MSDAEDEVWLLIRESNRAWMADAAHELASLYDERAVLVTPDLNRVEGRDAIVRSYDEYAHRAKTHAFEEEEHSVTVIGDAAFVRYRFTTRYTPNAEDEEREEGGEEVLALRRTPDGWRVLWRTQIAD